MSLGHKLTIPEIQISQGCHYGGNKLGICAFRDPTEADFQMISIQTEEFGYSSEMSRKSEKNLPREEEDRGIWSNLATKPEGSDKLIVGISWD